MKRLWPIGALIILVAILTREFFPKHVQGPPPPPMIVTVHDTLHDTLRISVPRDVPGPTLTIRVTVHDTTYVNVAAAPAERTNIWPVLSVDVGRKIGDTTTVNTFSLRSGEGGTAKIYTAGPLLAVWADSTPTPRYLFGSPPPPYQVHLVSKVKWGGLGFASCEVANALTRLLRP